MAIFILAIILFVLGFFMIVVGINVHMVDGLDLSENEGTAVASIGAVLMVVGAVLLGGYTIAKVEVTTDSSDTEIVHELVQTKTEKGDTYLLQKGDKVQFCCYLDGGVIETYEADISDVSVSYDDSESPRVEYTKTNSTNHYQWWIVAGPDYEKEVEHDYRFTIPSKEGISLEIEK